MAVPNFPAIIPANVTSALETILTGVGGESVRQAIVTALTWSVDNAIDIGQFINSLGLCVENGMLCYTTKDTVRVYQDIPEEFINTLQDILNADYGRDTRQSIVNALKWGGDYVSEVAGLINDLGLTVVDGKLCAVFSWAPATKAEQKILDAYTNRRLDVPDEGYTYIGRR